MKEIPHATLMGMFKTVLYSVLVGIFCLVLMNFVQVYAENEPEPTVGTLVGATVVMSLSLVWIFHKMELFFYKESLPVALVVGLLYSYLNMVIWVYFAFDLWMPDPREIYSNLDAHLNAAPGAPGGFFGIPDISFRWFGFLFEILHFLVMPVFVALTLDAPFCTRCHVWKKEYTHHPHLKPFARKQGWKDKRNAKVLVQNLVAANDGQTYLEATLFGCPDCYGETRLTLRHHYYDEERSKMTKDTLCWKTGLNKRDAKTIADFNPDAGQNNRKYGDAVH